jgi:Cu-Zn family superoxide dismutase
MNRLFRLSAIAAALAAVPALAATPMTGSLVGAGNAQMGTIQVTDAPGGVLLRVEASGLTPGWHAIHFHEKGVCDDAGFKASGSHVHAGKTPPVHGLLNPARKDNGDLPNFFVGADGVAKAEMYSTFVSMKGGAGRLALADADGSAIVVHANADDYTTQPIGGAGDRIACAVIK